tara:strand:- start:1298 stop:1480 length:183 start_codon:yes stop_codon:yes gene_type:complete
MIRLLKNIFKKKAGPNDKLLKNLEEYAKKEKAKQQESKVLGQKPVKQTRGKEKSTRMYHI